MATEDDLDRFLVEAENFLSDNDLGLNLQINTQIIEDVTHLMSMTPVEMYDLDLDKINQLGVAIGQYCTYVQKTRSKLENTILWCSFYINSQLAEEWKNELYDFMPKDMKAHSIAKSNSFLQKLMELRLVAESRLRGIPEEMDLLKNIAFRLGQIK